MFVSESICVYDKTMFLFIEFHTSVYYVEIKAQIHKATVNISFIRVVLSSDRVFHRNSISSSSSFIVATTMVQLLNNQTHLLTLIPNRVLAARISTCSRSILSVLL